jgi:hypothetical protein
VFRNRHLRQVRNRQVLKKLPLTQVSLENFNFSILRDLNLVISQSAVSKHSRNMRLIIIILSILFYTKTIFAQGSKNGFTNFDSTKLEIQKFESGIYNLPVDSIIDSTRIYYSIYQIESLVKIKKNSQVKRKKSFSYSLRENDSISLTQLNKENKNNFFSDYYILSKNDKFKKIKNHSNFFYIGRHIIGLGEKYLVIRTAQIYSTTDHRQTGASYIAVKYIYYEREN